jgi:ankyrin repeat protein
MGDDGATPRELLLEASRRNNTSLLSEILASQSSPAQISHLLNTATDGLGQYCLHVAATHGSYDVLDLLLDQEGLEVDPIDRLEADTPLHKAVRFVNGLAKSEWEIGASLVELLLDAGADPRIRNKAKLRAIELVDPRNSSLRSMLQRAEFAMTAGDDVLDGDDDDDDDGGTGSASDSE